MYIIYSMYVVSSMLGTKRSRAVRHMVVVLKEYTGHERIGDKHK